MFVGMSPSRPCEEALDCPEPYKCLAGSCGRLAEMETCKEGKGVSDWAVVERLVLVGAVAYIYIVSACCISLIINDISLPPIDCTTGSCLA